MISHETMMRHSQEGISIRALAAEIGVHHNKLRRAMLKAGIPIMSPGESISSSIKSGRSKTRKGAKITEEHKMSIAKANKGVKRKAQTKNNYILKRNQLARSEAARANRTSSKVGSKFERMVFDKLVELGYNVTQQYKVDDYKIDLFMNDYKLAIEIDGKSHWEPIYGTDRLAVTQSKDKAKDKAMELRGFHILRVRDGQSKPGLFNCSLVVQKIEEMIPFTKKNLCMFERLEIN